MSYLRSQTSITKMNTERPVLASESAPVNGTSISVLAPHSKAALKVGDRKSSSLFDLFLPNRRVAFPLLAIVALLEATLFVALWLFSPYDVLPRPQEVLLALQRLWLTQGLGQELATSFGLNLQALLLSSVISLGLAYLTVIPLFRPLVAAISKGRFLSLAGFTFIFTLTVGGGRPLQVALLSFAITVFYVTSMASVIAAIPRAEFEHARTLRMSEGRIVWEVVILGTADKAFEVLRQNAAMGWMMLSLIEGIVRSGGGIGAMLLAESKHFALAEVFAIQLVILTVGMMQDCGIEWLRRLLCPYSALSVERK